MIMLYLEDLPSEKIALCYGRCVYFRESGQAQGGYFKVLKLYRALLVVDPGFPAVDPGVDPGFPAACFSPGKMLTLMN